MNQPDTDHDIKQPSADPEHDQSWSSTLVAGEHAPSLPPPVPEAEATPPPVRSMVRPQPLSNKPGDWEQTMMLESAVAEALEAEGVPMPAASRQNHLGIYKLVCLVFGLSWAAGFLTHLAIDAVAPQLAGAVYYLFGAAVAYAVFVAAVKGLHERLHNAAPGLNPSMPLDLQEGLPAVGLTALLAALVAVASAFLMNDRLSLALILSGLFAALLALRMAHRGMAGRWGSKVFEISAIPAAIGAVVMIGVAALVH